MTTYDPQTGKLEASPYSVCQPAPTKTKIFVNRGDAERTRRGMHTEGGSLHVRRVSNDLTPDGGPGWAVSREDWNTSGVEVYLTVTGTWSRFDPS